jgi:histidinol dehydrogenase
MQVYQYSQLSPEELAAVISRPRIDFSSILKTVEPIIEDVRRRGDAAVREYTRRFDGVELDAVCTPIEVS